MSTTIPGGTSVTGTPGAGNLPADAGDGAENVPSATKALLLLDAFRSAGPTLGVSELARIADLPKSTAFRLLAYLEKSGYVERRGRSYCLGQRLFELGNRVPLCRPRGLRDVAMPHLSDLFVATGNTVHLGVLESTDVVYLEKIYGRNTIKVPTSVGGRMPAANSGLGKAMLAHNGREAIAAVLESGLPRLTRYSIIDPHRFLQQLRTVRDEGVAFDREEIMLGLVCAAAPIIADGRAVGAVSISSQTTGFNATQLAAQVRRTAQAISTEYAAVVAA